MKDARKGRMQDASRGGSRTASLVILALSVLALGFGSGCATKGDFRKLEERVLDQSRQSKKQPDPFERIAALSAEIESLRQDQQRMAGQLEVTQKKAEDALTEARKARQAEVSKATKAKEAQVAKAAAAKEAAETAAASKELVAYQEALRAWRADEQQLCIDQFRDFLQKYPASPYADDAAYWMADCYFKQADYRVAVLRFNDVVRVYPTGNKAADALYRQGESLLKLGPGFHDAARTVFKQVVKDYPDSDRAREAEQKLQSLGVG